MKAAVLFDDSGKFFVEDVILDSPEPNEVIVDVRAAGLCHSDLHFLRAELPVPLPAVLGHEGAGIVREVGRDVTYVSPGDHVVVFSAGSCGQCEWCYSGRHTLCQQGGLQRPPDVRQRLHLVDGRQVFQFTNLATFAESLLVHENSLVKIDKEMPLDRAAVVGCAVPTGVGAVIRTAKVPVGATVAVVGCGGIGLNCVQGAALAGAHRIIGIDINDGKLELAREFGATDVINNAGGDTLQQLESLLPGSGGVEYSFEALGLKATCELAVSVLRPGGVATIIGLGAGTFEVPIMQTSQEKRIQGCRMGSVDYRKDLPFFLDLYMRGLLKLDELVSNTIPLDQINEGYDAIADGAIARSVISFG
jgi:S-(hydroxymethyl)glutathione dehydrogenase / alcohol dehydrogenase